jgi:hypothetical protein
MECEQSGDDEAACTHARGPIEQQEENQNIEQVEKQIRNMMGAGIQPVNGNIEGVGKKSQRRRVSDAGAGRGESPFERRPVQACLNMGVVAHVQLVIVVEKRKASDRTIDRRGHEQEEETAENARFHAEVHRSNPERIGELRPMASLALVLREALLSFEKKGASATNQ